MSYVRAQAFHYDPLQLCTRRSSAFASARALGGLRNQKLAFLSAKFGRCGVSLVPFGDSNSRDGAFSRRSSCLHPGRAHSFHSQRHSFSSQNEFVFRNLSSRDPGVCRFFIHTDDALSSINQRVFWQQRGKHHICLRTSAFNPQSGGGGGGDGGRTIFNLAAAGLLTYLTVTGGLNWLFDAILSLWLVSAVLWWFAGRSLIRGACPNCGGAFQVFEFSLKEEQRLCPYCSQPFKLENRKFVREEPHFSNQRKQGYEQPFGGFRGFEGFGQRTSRKNEDSSGVIVDIEAEVRDKD